MWFCPQRFFSNLLFSCNVMNSQHKKSGCLVFVDSLEHQSLLILSSISSHSGFCSGMHKLNPMHFRQLIIPNSPGGEKSIKSFKTKILPLKNPTVCGACVDTGTSNKIILQKVSQLLLEKGTCQILTKAMEDCTCSRSQILGLVSLHTSRLVQQSSGGCLLQIGNSQSRARGTRGRLP